MKMSLNRRQMLFASGAALMGAGPLVGRSFGAPRSATPKVLFFTKSSGYQHSVITRKDGQLSHAEKLLTMLGQHGGFEVVASKDGTLFDPDKIGQFDAFVFETTGILTEKGDHNDGPPMSADGKKAFLDAIAGGKGFVGMHCATDTFHSPPNEIDPYIKMIGGEFIVHGKQQVANLYVCDPAFPGAKAYPVEYKINDEWYAQKNLADDLHVIVLVDYENDSLRTALEVADALGDRLWGVRLDTSATMVDRSLWQEMGRFNPTGVVPELVHKVRDALDSAGHNAVRIVASGGFDAQRIAAFEAQHVPVDAYGVGSSLLLGSNDFTADIVRVDGRPCAKVGRSEQPSDRLATVELVPG